MVTALFRLAVVVVTARVLLSAVFIAFGVLMVFLER